jgi:hypothetical protein
MRRPSRFSEAGFESMKMGAFLLFERTKRPDLHRTSPPAFFAAFRWQLGARCKARRNRAAAEMVAWPGGNTARQHPAVPDRHGGLRRCASSQSQAQGSRSPFHAALPRRSEPRQGQRKVSHPCRLRYSAPRMSVILPRCRGDRRGGATPDHEVRCDQDRRSARLAGGASCTRAIGQSAHRQESGTLRNVARHREFAGFIPAWRPRI